MRQRTLELMLLVLGAVPVLLIFALVEAERTRTFGPDRLSVPALLVALFLSAHVAVRRSAPEADPALLPCALVLSGIGLAMIDRLDPELGRAQSIWLSLSVFFLVATLAWVKEIEHVARFKYSVMLAGLVLLLAPAVVGREINGAKLWIRIGAMSFQPGELAKICIIVFLAAYLAENREMLSVFTRRILGLPVPEPRKLGPLLVMWSVSLVVLVFERDLGSSLLLFALFLAMLYVATGRGAYVAIGLALFGAGAFTAWTVFDHVKARIAIWLDPFADAAGRGYQLAQSLFALAAGGVLGVGPGRGSPERIPFVETDFIFSAVGEELGLLGAAAVVICFIVIVSRGFATALRARSDVSALTAAGLTFSIGSQAFVIIGGVTRLVPLTGVTLPFMSYGGSSLLATFIALALLLKAGDAATGTGTELRLTCPAAGALGRSALARRVRRTTQVLMALLVTLVANLTSIQVVSARSLATAPANTRGVAEAARTDRGTIVTRDGVVLAESVRAGRRTFERRYPEGVLAAHAVGYLSPRYGRSGIEAAADDALSGSRSFRTWQDAIDAAVGRPVEGNDVVLTIDARIQRAAERALGSRRGAIVVIDPRTGAVLASVSRPAYDPADVDSRWEQLSGSPGAPLLDRTRQALYPPGSTFKVVTLTAAYGSGVARPDSTYPAPARIVIGNAPVTNYGGSGYGRLDLVTATARSVNTVFAQLADELGAERLVEQSRRFGIGSPIPYELPIVRSLMPDPREMTRWETAWAGVGQPVGEHASPAGPQVTVVQMALVAAAIANDGVAMRPYLIDRVTHRGRGYDRPLGITRPRVLTRATDPGTARLVAAAMQAVVSRGSGTRAALPGAVVCGKTGTAEVGKGRPTHAWFIGFAPRSDPTVAIAVLVEGGGTGGRAAAPVAREVLRAALAAQAARHGRDAR